MLDEYEVKGPTVKIEAEVEEKVAELIQQMANFKHFTNSEIINTALKRFIANHKDFLPRKIG